MSTITLTNLHKPIPEPADKKTCLKCNQEKERDEFRKSERYVDFRSNTCKQCEKKRTEELANARQQYSAVYFTHTGAF